MLPNSEIMLLMPLLYKSCCDVTLVAKLLLSLIGTISLCCANQIRYIILKIISLTHVYPYSTNVATRQPLPWSRLDSGLLSANGRTVQCLCLQNTRPPVHPFNGSTVQRFNRSTVVHVHRRPYTKEFNDLGRICLEGTMTRLCDPVDETRAWETARVSFSSQTLVLVVWVQCNTAITKRKRKKERRKEGKKERRKEIKKERKKEGRKEDEQQNVIV